MDDFIWGWVGQTKGLVLAKRQASRRQTGHREGSGPVEAVTGAMWPFFQERILKLLLLKSGISNMGTFPPGHICDFKMASSQ